MLRKFLPPRLGSSGVFRVEPHRAPLPAKFLDSLQDPGFTSVFPIFKVVFRLIFLKAISKKLRRQENRMGKSSIKLLHLVEQCDSHLC